MKKYDIFFKMQFFPMVISVDIFKPEKIIQWTGKDCEII